MVCKKGFAFDKVLIEGSWVVRNISTALFADLNYCNSLKDVFALSNKNCHNIIYIAAGDYEVRALRKSDACIRLNDDSEIIFDGHVILQPNDFICYSIVRIEGSNIILKGNGFIEGDKTTHIGTEGEWGMGVAIYNGRNIKIENLFICNCWGDCIYIAEKSQKITIRGCRLSDSRRQGISVISASDVKIDKCVIKDIKGTEPQFGIDIEPNKGDTVRRVKISKTIIDNCKGGIMTFGRALESIVEDVILTKCIITNVLTNPVHLNKSEKVTVKNCEIYCSKKYNTIDCFEIKNVLLKNNKLKVPDSPRDRTSKLVTIRESQEVQNSRNQIIYY